MERRIAFGIRLLLLGVLVSASTAAAQLSESFCSEAVCGDGLFCNGQETCTTSGCAPGLDPCPGRACDEGLDLCLPGQWPKLEGGWAQVGDQPQTVILANSYQRPVVVAGVHYGANDPPLVVRVHQVTSETLELYLQTPSGAPVPQRRVSYLVVEEGAWEADGRRFEAQRFASTVTDQEGQMVGEPTTFLQAYKKPVVLGQVMSSRDAAWSVFWAGGQDTRRAPSWSAVQSGKTVGADPQGIREEEILGFVVFEAGHGRLGAAELEAGVTGSAVVGMGNSFKPYQHPFLQGFKSAPQIALTSVAGLSDPDAGWAVVPTALRSAAAGVASKSALPLAIDEDQLGDAERTHGPEQVAYLVFDRPFSYEKSPVPPPGVTFPGGSDYYSCRVDESVLGPACSNALPAIQQSIDACEQAVESCSSLVDVGGDCASCLSPIPSWKKLPVVAFLFCVPQCGGSLLDFAFCRDNASSLLRTEVDLDICTNCGGTTCGNRYGIDVNTNGLRCDEAVMTTVKCESEELPTLLSVDYVNPDMSLPGWCSNPDRWEVGLSQVFDLNDLTPKRECTPTERSGPPGVTNNVQANFDCSCSGADCGDTATSYPLVADVSCMPVNSWFKLQTTVTDACGGNPRQRVVRVDYSNPPVDRFPINLQARPGERIASLVIQDSQGATCFNEGDIDSTMPANPPGGELSVARIRCRDDVGAGGCEAVPLSGRATGEGLGVRPNGVTLHLTVGGSTETKTVTTSTFSFQTNALPGQSYSVSVNDPVYSYGPGNRSKSFCFLQSPRTGTVPAGGTFEIAHVDCQIEILTIPPRPDIPPVLDPFDWDWDSGLDCDYLCDPNPPGSSGGLEPCDPCTYCFDSSTNTCPSECFCETVDVPGGECGFDCIFFFNASPSLAVVAGGGSTATGQVTADGELKVSGQAFDGDGLQGFVISVDGEYRDLVMSSGTSASFNDLAVDTSTLAPGEHTLQVVALDAHGSAPTPVALELPFEVDHTVDPCQGDAAPPSLTITAPPAGGVLAPGTVQIQASASDAGSGVKHLKFWAGSQYLGLDSTFPYSQSWTATPGTHTLKVRAWDHCNNQRLKEITVTVADPCAGAPAPTVAITNYQDGQWVDPALFHFEATAQDHSGSGIDRVEFEVESFSNVAVDETPPYVSTGWYLLTEQDEVVTARAYDGCGRVAADVITLHVNENSSVCGIDQNLPWAGVAQPTEGAILPAGPVTIRANAADDGVLLAAVLEVDGSLVPNSTILSSNPANYVWTWNATPGPHVIRVKVVDVCWKIGWSLSRSVIVQ